MAYLDKDGVSKLWTKIKALFNKGITGLSVSGRTITYTKGDGTTGTITTQDTNTTYSAFKGATASADGGTGLVPAPVKGNEGRYLKGDGTWGTPANTTYGVVSKSANGLAPQLPNETSTTKYLRQDGTWSVPPDNNTTYNDATQSSRGLMTAADKKKLDGIEPGAQPNQESFSELVVGDKSYDAPIVGAAINFKATGAATVSLDNSGNVVIGATNTTYSDATQSTHGLMSTADKTKLDGLPSMTELDSNFLRKTTASSTFLTQTNAANTYLTQANASNTYAKKSDITGMYKYKGSVADASKLPTTGQTVGDVYNVEAAGIYGGAGMNVAWNGEAWDPLGEIFTITAITNTELDTICV